MFERILFPTDGSEVANEAGEHALNLAERFGSELVVLFVIEQHYLYAGPSAPRDMWDEIVHRARDEAGQRTEPIVQEAKARGIPVARRVVEKPRVAEAILDTAREEDVDAIVMGTHGRSGVGRFLVGSVAERVLRHAGIPVVMVPGEKPG